MYSINYHATGLSWVPASSSNAGQMRTLPEHISRLGTPLKFPRFLGIPRAPAPGSPPPGPAAGWPGRGLRRAKARRRQERSSTCYLATQKATGRIPFGTPGKAFNFISSHVNIPECLTGGLCFTPNNINILFAATQVCSSYPNSSPPRL